MSTTLTSTETYSLLSLSLACLGVLSQTFVGGDGEPVIASIAFSGLAFASCYALIRWLGNAFIRRGFKGKDLCKHKQTELPETMGAVCAMVYLFTIIAFIPWPFYKDIVIATSGGGNRDVMQDLDEVETGRSLHKFPHNKVHTILSFAIVTIPSLAILIAMITYAASSTPLVTLPCHESKTWHQHPSLPPLTCICSLHPTFRPSYPSKALCSWALAMISSTSGGDTKCLSRPLPRSQCSSSTLWTSV